MTKILNVTSNPQTFSSNTWKSAALAFNGGVTKFTFTPTAASVTFTGGSFHCIFGQVNGGNGLLDTAFQKFTAPGDVQVYSQTLTWLAGQAITIVDDARAKTVTISGATTGNGTFSYTVAGPYWDPATALGVGHDGTSAFTFAGTISILDDTTPDSSWEPRIPGMPMRRTTSTALLVAALVAPPVVPVSVPPLSWSPTIPDYQLRGAPRPLNVGGESAPTTIVAPPVVTPLSWAPAFPDLVPRARGPLIVGGMTGPEATLTNIPAPLMSWTPVFPDLVPRARAPLNVGGMTGPEAVIPNPPTPGLSWLPQYPDILNRPRHPVHAAAGLTAPPFAGGASLTIGAAAIRQSILSQLAFSTPLTTFGTDLTFTASGNTLTMATHGMIVTAGPFQLRTTGTLPAGSDSTTFYYMIVPSTTTVQLALTPALAKAGTAVTLTDAGTGTHTLVRSVNTAPLHSTFLAIFARGTQASSPNQATDSFGNTYSYIPSAPRQYDAFTTSSFSISTAISAKGGNAHTWSASIGNIGGQQDEVTIGGLEIFNARILQSSSVVEIADGTQATLTSGSVTTTARALLIAVVGGNGNVNQNHVYTTPPGYTRIARICAEGDPNAAGYIQIEVFAKFVDIKGTYQYSTQGTVAGPGPEGAMLWHLAFQAVASDLSPFDWNYPQAEMPRGARRPIEGGETAPPRLIVSGAPPLSWSPVFPDFTPRIARGQAGGETAPPSFGDSAKLLTWLPTVVDPIRARRVIAGGETAPPVVPAPAPWSPIFPDWILRPRWRIDVGETAPVLAPAAPIVPSLESWAPSFPDALGRIGARIQGGETAPPAAPAPAVIPLITSWSPTFPNVLARIVLRQTAGEVAPVAIVAPAAVPPLNSWLAQPVMVPLRARSAPPGEAVGPVLIIPQAPAPPLWAPVFPDFVLRRRTAIPGGEVAPFTAALNLKPALVELNPIVVAISARLLIVKAKT